MLVKKTTVRNATSMMSSRAKLRTQLSMLASYESVYVGLSSHALALFGKQSSSFAQSLAAYAAMFPSLEMKFTLPALPTESVLRSLIEQKQLHVLWHFKLLDLIADEHATRDFFMRPEWQSIVTALLENASDRHFVVLSFDRSVEHSESLMSKLEELAETVRPLSVAFEFEHGSWKRSEKIFSAIHAPVVELDAPRLPGLIKPLHDTNRHTAFLRLVGRNARAWLKHADEERFAYAYIHEEIAGLVGRVSTLKLASDRVFVTCATYPAQASYDCAANVVQEFVRQRTAETMLNAA